jgi:hypothetical protein
MGVLEKMIGFVTTNDPGKAKAFYGEVLGFRLTNEDDYAVVFDANGTMLRVGKSRGDFKPAQGTVLELMLIWQLLQVRHVQGTPLILVGKMWPGLVDWASSQLLKAEPPLANPDDIAIPRCADNADEAIEFIRQEHTQWLQER